MIVAWGENQFGQCEVPPLPEGLEYVEVAAGQYHNLARRSDGSVIGWGSCSGGTCIVPALPAGLVYVEVATGEKHGSARRSDGSVVAWTSFSNSVENVPALPAGLTYVEIAASDDHCAARRSDGSLVVWGNTSSSQLSAPALPPGAIYVEVATGGNPDALPGEVQIVARYATAPAVTVYCTAKTNSLGCLPSIGASGWPSATAGSGFQVTGVDQLNNKAGFLFYGMNGAAALPFYGGTKCVNPPIKRTLVQDSLGTPAPAADCSGIFAVDMNAFAVGALGGNPDPALSVPGTVVNCQWWSRDAAGNTALSDGLEYAIGL
jgi:hypothetical protein